MAGNLLAKYGTNGQTITITLASLANGSARQGVVVDNTGNTFIDALVFVKIKTGASGISASGNVSLYFYGTVDGGTLYTDGASGSDAGFTPTSPTNLLGVRVINAVATATQYYGGPFSVAAAFGGVLPDHWGVVIANNTGAAFDATGGNFLVEYQGIEGQYT